MGNCGATEAHVQEKHVRPQPRPRRRQSLNPQQQRRSSTRSMPEGIPPLYRENSMRRVGSIGREGTIKRVGSAGREGTIKRVGSAGREGTIKRVGSIGREGTIKRMGSMGKGTGIITHRNVAALNLANLNNAVSNINPSLLPPGSPCSQGLSDSSASHQGAKSMQMKISTVVETFTSEGFIDYVGTYKLQSRVGVGSYGTVFAALDETSNQKYAIKTFDKHSLSQRQLRRHVWPEAQILTVVCNRSKNIVNLRQVLESERYVYLILELVEGSNLQKVIRTEHLSEYRVKTYFKSIVEAIAVLHNMNVVHRDIKPENILIDTTLDEAKLVDFGFACKFETGQLLRHPCGSPQYVAPEVISGQDDIIRYEPTPVDIWSAGATLYELLTGRAPFENNNRTLCSKDRVKGLFALIQSASYPKERLASVSPEARDLVDKMLVRDPSMRITAEEILQHPWLNSSSSMGKRLSQSSVSSGAPAVVGEYTLGIPLGRDYIGTIHSCIGKDDSTLCLRVAGTSSLSCLTALVKETEILSKINSNCVQSTREIFEDNGFWYGVSNFVPGDTLHKKITNRSIGSQLCHRLRYTHQLLSTLSFLHQLRIVHRQVNPHNIIVDEVNDRLVFVNFGSAEKSGTVVNDIPNISAFTAPELKAPDGSSSAESSEDVFALGVILYQLYEYGKIPSRPPVFKHTSNHDARELVEGMLNPDPSLRLSSHQACQSKYLLSAKSGAEHNINTTSIPGLDSLRKFTQQSDSNEGLTSESSTSFFSDSRSG